MSGLETLIVGQSGEANALEFLQLRGKLRARVHDDEPTGKLSIVPAHGRLKHCDRQID
jgi:hypothetical protein